MDTNQNPLKTDEPQVMLPPGARTPKFRLSIKLAILAAGIVMVFSGSMFVGYRIHVRSTKLVAVTGANHTAAKPSAPQLSRAVTTAPTTNQPSNGTNPPPAQTPPKLASPSTNTSVTTVKPSAPVAVPPAPAPWVNTTNCLPQNPTKYQQYFTSMTNAQYLQTNSYVNTNKLYAALQFAGLLDTINSKQYVVLAMDDSQWNFTASQLAWMYASPANMKQVLGWQVITSCITWNGYNPVQNMAAGTTTSVQTLNGPVTFTAGSGGVSVSGLGRFGNGNVGIWDWFTSNGSVTICGFVDTSALPN